MLQVFGVFLEHIQSLDGVAMCHQTLRTTGAAQVWLVLIGACIKVFKYPFAEINDINYMLFKFSSQPKMCNL